jgi:hypothetical protein
LEHSYVPFTNILSHLTADHDGKFQRSKTGQQPMLQQEQHTSKGAHDLGACQLQVGAQRALVATRNRPQQVRDANLRH